MFVSRSGGDYASEIEEDLRGWLEYSEENRRALALGNRGAVELDDNGNLDPLIVEACQRPGFYVFTDVLGGEIGELAFGCPAGQCTNLAQGASANMANL